MNKSEIIWMNGWACPWDWGQKFMFYPHNFTLNGTNGGQIEGGTQKGLLRKTVDWGQILANFFELNGGRLTRERGFQKFHQKIGPF